MARITSRIFNTALAVTLLICGAGVLAQQESSLVSGSVVSQSSGRSLTSAMVRLDGLDRASTTSAGGEFIFPDVPAGSYTLSVYFEGEWFPYMRRVRVAGDGTPIQVKLEVPILDSDVQERVTVTARRRPSELNLSAAAVTTLTREQLDRIAAPDLGTALQQVAGLNFYANGGNPADPSLNVRGFTGGGENDYLLVLVDGIRINGANTSRVDWREIPMAEVERVEVLRGSGSALYGDTATGGVIQIFTRGTDTPSWGASVQGGSFGRVGVDGQITNQIGGLNFRAHVSYDEADGWRDNSDNENLTARLRIGKERNDRDWSAQLWVRSDDHGNPGALDQATFDSNQEATSTPLDRVERDRITLALSDRRPLGDQWRLESQANVRTQDDAFRETVIGATSERRIESIQLWIDSRAYRSFSNDRLRLTSGAEVSVSDYDSEISDVNSNGTLAALTAAGTGNRLGLGAYGELEARPRDNISLTAGLRYDRLDDSFDETLVTFENSDPTNDAVSPRVGAAWQLTDGASVWAQAGRSFKAPTPFQLFDQRRFFGSVITNPNLEPTTGNDFSVGYRQDIHGRYFVDATFYLHDLKDEIGFDAANFRTANIAESRHAGYEINAEGRFGLGWNATLSYALNDAEIRAGDNLGNQINNVPRQTASAGLSWGNDLWQASGQARFIGDNYLDDANRLSIDDYVVVSARVSRVLLHGFSVELSLDNLFDEEYATWGFESPIDGSPQYFPGEAASAIVRVRYRPDAGR